MTFEIYKGLKFSVASNGDLFQICEGTSKPSKKIRKSASSKSTYTRIGAYVIGLFIQAL